MTETEIILQALERLLAQCDRLRLTDQKETAEEKNAREVIAKARPMT